ncbi:MAG: DMT family transporter [Saprospiraceae bacterium]|nr:DMT family transporter [Saprospiraceae bacterium]MBK7523694.1 DMT family transporter [Saprospiraceae bacterium]MBK8853948.1 DMT family transporter [Saprospiraceae bacterium]MBK9044980.1 DMT family transporter [Saprospiraceae bacterium]
MVNRTQFRLFSEFAVFPIFAFQNRGNLLSDQHQKAIWLTVIAAILWSTGGLFVKLLTLDAFTILFYRSFYAALLFIVLFRKQLLVVNKLTFISALFYAPLLICFVSATKLTTAANAIFLQYTAPAFILILEPFFVRTKLLKINVITVILTFLGMLLFFFDDFSGPDNMLGIILALAGGVVLTGLLISQKMNAPAYQPGAVFWGNILVCLITLPWAVQNPFPDVVQNSYLMILGFGQLGLGFALFVYGQKYLTAIESSLISMLEPVLNPVWVIIWYGEIPGYFALTGGAIIVFTLMYRMIFLHRMKRNLMS